MTFRAVSIEEWQISNQMPGERRRRLLEPPAADALLAALSDQARSAAEQLLIPMAWREASDAPGYFRIEAQIPLDLPTFDQLFNGTSGYRAQYYLSPEEGVIYNRAVLASVEDALCYAQNRRQASSSLANLRQSLRMPHAKVWVFDEQRAFNEALPGLLTPVRWRENGATLGCRAPLLANPHMDVKGSFVRPSDGALFVDPLKVTRSLDLHLLGFS